MLVSTWCNSRSSIQLSRGRLDIKGAKNVKSAFVTLLKNKKRREVRVKEVLEFGISSSRDSEKEGYFPFARAPIWELQREYFDQKGMKAWSTKEVPHFATSNPFIAHAYGQIVFSFLRDWVRNRESLAFGNRKAAFSETLYLIELGAGSGRFSYHFMKRFFALIDKSPFRDFPLCYVMTDFTVSNIKSWRRHKKLQSWVKGRRLDFARFDIEKDTSIILMESGRTLAPHSLNTPLVIMANYFFDSLRQDLFFVEEGKLYEGWVAGMDSEGQPIKDSLFALEELRYRRCPIAAERRCTDPIWQQHLEAYRRTLPSCPVIVPSVGLKGLSNLQKISTEGFLLLSADRGSSRLEDLQREIRPRIGLHGGAFSLPVNYHLISRYLEAKGAKVKNVLYDFTKLNVILAVKGREDEEGASSSFFPETECSFEEHMETFSLSDTLKIRSDLRQFKDRWDIDACLSCLRLNHWDHTILAFLKEKLVEELSGKSFSTRKKWSEAIEKVAEMYFDIGESHNFPYICGTLLETCGFWKTARKFYEQSLSVAVEARTYLKIAQCHWHLGLMEDARKALEDALSVDPENPEIGKFAEELTQWEQFCQSSPQGFVLQEIQASNKDSVRLELLGPKHHFVLFKTLKDSCDLPLIIASPKSLEQVKNSVEQLTGNVSKKYFALLNHEIGFSGIVSLERRGEKGFIYFWITEKGDCCGLISKVFPTLRALVKESGTIDAFYYLVHQKDLSLLGILEDENFQRVPSPLGDPLALYRYSLTILNNESSIHITPEEIEAAFSR